MEQENDIARSEFDVDKLEAVIIDEAEQRGDRLYRIILTPRESAFFPRERISIEVARMESSFNVVRVCPEPNDLSENVRSEELPARVVFFITTMLPFERAAALAAARLNGAVDIAEVPFECWKEETDRWCAESSNPPRARRDEAKTDIALLVLSYKVLSYDMERILEAVAPGSSSNARASMSKFESRLSSYQATRVPFLFYKRKGALHLVPRFMVQGFFYSEDGKRVQAFLPDAARPERPLDEGRGDSRFGIILGGGDGKCIGSAGADRLVSYKEIALRDIAVEGRPARGLFEIAMHGQRAILVLPDLAPEGRA